MNEIVKTVISEKLRKACKEESLSQQVAANLLGLKSKHYGGFIASGNPNQFKNVSKEAWEQVRAWTNSGETIKNYSRKVVREAIGTMSDDELEGNVKPSAFPGHSNPPPHPPIKKVKRQTSWLGKKNEMNDKLSSVSVEEFKKMFPALVDERMIIPIEINIVIKINGQEIQL